jgi:hypothetical protein
MSDSSKRSTRGSVPIWLILVAGALVMALGVGGVYAMSRPAPRHEAEASLPQGLEQPPTLSQVPRTTREAYAWAATHYDVMAYIPCYCGCGGAHRNNFECYYKHDGNGTITAYEEHALGCQVCVDITRETMRLWQQGKNLPEIRKAIDEMYKGQDLNPTPTPQPPKS